MCGCPENHTKRLDSSRGMPVLGSVVQEGKLPWCHSWEWGDYRHASFLNFSCDYLHFIALISFFRIFVSCYVLLKVLHPAKRWIGHLVEYSASRGGRGGGIVLQGRRNPCTGTSPLKEVFSSAPFCMLYVDAWMLIGVPPEVPAHNFFFVLLLFVFHSWGKRGGKGNY